MLAIVHGSARCDISSPMMDLNACSLNELYEYFSSLGLIRRLLELAHDEDLGSEAPCDVTTRVCQLDSNTTQAAIVTREPCIVAGLAVMNDLIEVFAQDCQFSPVLADGQQAQSNQTLGHLTGPVDQILRLERPMLNLLGRLSGIATRTGRFVQASAVHNRVYDTRKTIPGLRHLEKYAVRCGQGSCHRLGLYDAVLIKDNHIAHLSLDEMGQWIADATHRAWPLRASQGLRFVEVEVDSIDQLKKLLTIEQGLVDFVLLDNMTLEELSQAVILRNELTSTILLEASGNVTLDTIHSIAQTGVDRISVGSLTHQAVWVDIGLDFSKTDHIKTHDS